jgi:hypothetical protein
MTDTIRCERIRDLVAMWVASSDKSFTDVEHPLFLRIIEVANPAVLNGIKTANTVRSDIFKMFEENREATIKPIRVFFFI